MKETNKEVCTAAVVTDNASLISYIYTHLLHTKYQTMRMRLLLNQWPVKRFVFWRTKCTLKYDCNSKYHMARNISIKIFLVIYRSLISSHFDYWGVAWFTVNKARRGYSPNFWVEVCRTVLKTLTLISDQSIWFFIPLLQTLKRSECPWSMSK